MNPGLYEKSISGGLPAVLRPFLPSGHSSCNQITLKLKAMSVVAHPSMSGEAEVRRLRTLYQLLSELSHARALEEVYAAAITSLLDATASDRAAILLFDTDGVMRFKASRGLSDEYQAAVTGHSPWSRGALDAQPLVVPDVRLDESLVGYRDVLEREGIRGLAFVPLA